MRTEQLGKAERPRAGTLEATMRRRHARSQPRSLAQRPAHRNRQNSRALRAADAGVDSEPESRRAQPKAVTKAAAKSTREVASSGPDAAVRAYARSDKADLQG